MSGDRLLGEFVDTNILIYAFDATAGDAGWAGGACIVLRWRMCWEPSSCIGPFHLFLGWADFAQRHSLGNKYMSHVSPPRPDLAAHRDATTAPFSKLVRELVAVIGRKLTAYIAGVKDVRALDRWIFSAPSAHLWLDDRPFHSAFNRGVRSFGSVVAPIPWQPPDWSLAGDDGKNADMNPRNRQNLWVTASTPFCNGTPGSKIPNFPVTVHSMNLSSNSL